MLLGLWAQCGPAAVDLLLLVSAAWEVFVEPKLPEDRRARDARLNGAPAVRGRATFAWPWGLVAIGVMALAWVGVYLLWNGFAFLFNW